MLQSKAICNLRIRLNCVHACYYWNILVCEHPFQEYITIPLDYKQVGGSICMCVEVI